MTSHPDVDYASIARRMAENPPPRGRREPPAVETCGVCGGVKGNVVFGCGDFCRCGRLVGRGHAQLAAVDPGGAMRFDSLDDPHPTLRRAARLALAAARGESGRGVAMFGRPGRGKSHVAVSACRVALSRGVAAGYYNVVELVGRIQDTYSSREEETRRVVIEGVAKRRLVVLDDLGKEHRSANVDSIIFEIVNALHLGRSTLLLCSNLTDRDYRDRYDEAVRSRLAGMCEAVVVAGEDRRGC